MGITKSKYLHFYDDTVPFKDDYIELLPSPKCFLFPVLKAALLSNYVIWIWNLEYENLPDCSCPYPPSHYLHITDDYLSNIPLCTYFVKAPIVVATILSQNIIFEGFLVKNINISCCPYRPALVWQSESSRRLASPGEMATHETSLRRHYRGGRLYRLPLTKKALYVKETLPIVLQQSSSVSCLCFFVSSLVIYFL